MIYFPVCANYIWIVFKDLHKNVFIVHVYERMYFISCVFFKNIDDSFRLGSEKKSEIVSCDTVVLHAEPKS